jgi:hypothetical protein
LAAVPAQTVAQNIGRPAQKLFSYSPSTTLLFGGFKVVFEIFMFESAKRVQMPF